MATYKVLKQYDSRWGSKNYNGSSSIATAACGPFSVTNVLNSIKGNNIKPMNVVKFMQKHNYAAYKQGTRHSGIPAALKEFGAEDVKEIDVRSSMVNVWSYLKKGYKAVFLFEAGSRGGICWTTSGHYVGIADYKLKNKKHILYTMDSGGRDHDGWYTYETQMRSLIYKVWVAKVPKLKPKKKTLYAGTFPSLPKKGYLTRGDEGDQVKLLQKFLNWAVDYGLTVDGIFGAKTTRAVQAFQDECSLSKDGVFGSKSLAAAKKFKA